jgi:hypothetical protein
MRLLLVTLASLLATEAGAAEGAPASAVITITLSPQELNDIGTNLIMAMRACVALADQQVPACVQRALTSMQKLQDAVNSPSRTP